MIFPPRFHALIVHMRRANVRWRRASAPSRFFPILLRDLSQNGYGYLIRAGRKGEDGGRGRRAPHWAPLVGQGGSRGPGARWIKGAGGGYLMRGG